MNRKKSIIYTSIFVLILAVILASTTSLKGCFGKTLSRTFFAADTVCTITLYDGDEKILNGAVDLCNSLANRLNCKDENSEVYKLNNEKSSPSPSDDLLNIVTSALYYCEKSNGVFDVTVKPLSDLWDFKNEKTPNKNEISSALEKVGYKNLVIEKGSLTLKNNAELDLGAIAKGYMASKISDFLVENGVKSGIINLGGNVTVIGKNNGKNFTVGIQKPFEDGNAAVVSCSDTSVVTSGVYQRYFKKDGKIYHHLLNTKSGYPEQNELYSVTIISKSPTVADALSTLCFLLGREKATEFLKDFKGTEAVFIDQNQKIHLTSGLRLSGNSIELKSN